MLLGLLLACYRLGDFEVDYAVAACEKAYTSDCYTEDQLDYFPWDDLEDCIDNKEPDVELPAGDCDFEPKAARDCVEETAALDCSAFTEGRFPDSCHVVCGGELPE